MTIPFNLSKFADYLNASGNANPLVASDQTNTSTGSLGLPYGTTAQRPASPANGYTRINTTTGVLETYYNSAWNTVYTFPVPVTGTTKAIVGYGNPSGTSPVSLSNLISSSGVVATNTTGVGTARQFLAAAGYSTDKAIFGYGQSSNSGSSIVSMTNLVSNTGVIASDTTGVGTARGELAAARYGTDKAIFGYGYNGSANTAITNLVSNTGVVATDTAGVGTARTQLAATGYGTDKAIFGYGQIYSGSAGVSMTNLVSNTGVVSSDTTGVGTGRQQLAAACYGTDKAIFGYGRNSSYVAVSITNLVSNTGVVATDTTGVGTARFGLAGVNYGTDKAIFVYGDDASGFSLNISNLVSSTGVVSTNTTNVGTARNRVGSSGYSTT